MLPEARSHHAASVDAFFTSGHDGIAMHRVVERAHEEYRHQVPIAPVSASARRWLGMMFVRLGHGIAGTASLSPRVNTLAPNEAR